MLGRQKTSAEGRADRAGEAERKDTMQLWQRAEQAELRPAKLKLSPPARKAKREDTMQLQQREEQVELRPTC
ncbi:hypothetical protein ACLOJK_022091 [Asimina triloba]